MDRLELYSPLSCGWHRNHRDEVLVSNLVVQVTHFSDRYHAAPMVPTGPTPATRNHFRSGLSSGSGVCLRMSPVCRSTSLLNSDPSGSLTNSESLVSGTISNKGLSAVDRYKCVQSLLLKPTDIKLQSH